MFYPALTQFTCGECQKKLFDVDWAHGCTGTGKVKTYMTGAGPREQVRGKLNPPPCSECPKGSPEEEAEHLLSADNWLTWQIYREVKATNGACLTDAMKADALLMRNLAMLDELARVRERQQLGRELAANVARFLVR
ncbi:MAG TPA: hypothetical protein VGP68_16765 [Gemmataceae bacterium]|nr:hypothetical protein [Gemmataceae bacterium]